MKSSYAAHCQSLDNWAPNFVCWYPHSGARWLNRELLSRHPQIVLTEFFAPWLTLSVDRALALDTTHQVHRARVQSDLEPEFNAVVESVEAAIAAGISTYLAEKRALMNLQGAGKIHFGALPSGQHIGIPNFGIIEKITPQFRMVHLVRDPVDCFASLKSRMELDGDATRAAVEWLRLNGSLRRYFEHDAQRRTRYLMIRFEELRAEPQGTTERILAWAGLSWDPSQKDGIDVYRGRNEGRDMRSLVTTEEYDVIREITSCEAQRYGYDA